MPAVPALPAAFVAQGGQSADWGRFVDRLPALLRDLLGEWDLAVDGEVRHGACAVVVPVTTRDGEAAALKVGWPHWEAEVEHLALQHWHGDGAVRLLRADPRRFALLLERLHPEDLTETWDLEACEVVAGLYGRLHVAAPPNLPRLSDCVRRWTDGLLALPREAPLPRRYVEQAAAIGRDLAADPATDGRIVHTDLHYENVLAGDREPWLAIDPKPLSGDPHYEPAPMLWNRREELVGDERRGLRARFHALLDAAGLDEDRARDWAVFRLVCNGLWLLQDAQEQGRRLDADEQAHLTWQLVVAKAVQD